MKKITLLLIICLFTFQTNAQDITLSLFSDNLSQPLSLKHANDDRLFVVEKGGKIKIIQTNGSVNPTPFLDISSLISTNGERGLLGLAFHPDYQNTGYFYVNYTNTAGNTQISRFSVSSDADVADPTSELPLLSYSQPASNHNGGDLAFGPDNYLYIASGDGGGSGDPNNRAQDLNYFLGKILRIDVDNATGGNNYGIPADNPFVGNPDALDEIWAYGLRNPWRFSFDFTDNTIWIADVGQTSIEEINRANATDGGLNYGWRCYEGTQPYNTQNCPPQGDLTFPFAEYTHNNGNCSITGGYVYRGTVYTDISGLYFFADFCSGLIGSVDNTGNITNYGAFTGSWVSFGEDVNKELYIVDFNGTIYKIEGSLIANSPEFQQENQLKIFPNPASNNITFAIANDNFSNLAIYDVSGRIILSSENVNSNEIRLNVSKINSGVYFAKIKSNTGRTFVKKIIIK